MASKKTDKAVKAQPKKAEPKKASKAAVKAAPSTEVKKEEVKEKAHAVVSIRYIDKVNAPYYFKDKEALAAVTKEKKYGFWTLVIDKVGTQFTFLRKAKKVESDFIKEERAKVKDASKMRFGVVSNRGKAVLRVVTGNNVRRL